MFSNGLTGVFEGTTIIHGYPYNRNYDNRLQAEEPPHFLNPIQAAWSSSARRSRRTRSDSPRL